MYNGIIENYQELKEKQLKHGYVSYSQTDTEVVVELMFPDYPGEIWVARKDSPMSIGITDGETYVASDVLVIL